ncbi:NACHT domain-containing protein [Streptomyces echinoruber]|uniref:NACHT domain-containing protein n=1 Tax=Streptomyces echinoruber TaxID=68898 RepID=UPI00167E0C07|nr:ATP-binding protein [Streptomyces echinoruber]
MNAVYLALSAMYLLLIVYSFVAPKKIYSFNSWQGALAAIGLSSTAVIATVWFIFWRFRRARSYYLRKAKRFPGELVKPGSIIGEVVGRDQLCDALMNDLRDRRQRRPHVIVGTLGVGKTALLVRLTQRLARKGVVPVVLQLRDVRDVREFNFSKLAARKFCAEVLEWVSSRSEAEKIWQRLRHTQDRAVVLADGLEEALKGADDRDNKIRKAINDAREAKLPLVMTSRPQKSLEAIDAAQTVLEPLSEEAALRYVAEGSNWRSNRQRMDWVVEAAEIAESPIYLNIAKDLELRGLLEPIVGGGEDEKCDPRDQDVWTLRYDLLDAWIQALVKGHLYPEQPLSYKGRFTTVEYLSVLACAALHTNSTYAGYGALTATPAAAADASGEGGVSGGSGGTGEALVVGALRARLRKRLESVADGCDAGDGPAGNFDERLAGSWGSRLGLVEEQGEGVRFHHSVLQAYLASRYMDALVRCEETVRPPRSEAVAAASSTAPAGGRPPNDPQPVPAPSAPSVEEAYFGQALQRPGRELAMALVFYSRSMEALKGNHGQHGSDTHGADGHGSDAHGTDAHGIDDCPIGIVRDRLEEAAGRALQGGSAQAAGAGRDDAGSGDIEQDPKIRALELYSAALDVDSFHHRPRHHDIVQTVRDGWEKLQVYNDRKLDAPKKALIQRIGATGRLLSKRHALPPWDVQEVQGETAYAHLFEITGKEPSHSVRFTIAQAIGEGGDDAYRTLERELFRTSAGASVPAGGKAEFFPTGMNVDDVFYAFSYRPGASEAVSRSTSGSPGTCEADGPPSAPGTTRTERLLRKERARRLSKHQRDEEAAEQREREAEEREHRKEIMRAWLAPMLVRSCSFTPHRSTPYELLSWWMERLRDGRVDLRQQVALAQGFRQAANHRTPPTEPARARDFLNEQAWKMLKYTRYWFARLVLLHALTLWALPDDITQRQPRHGHGARPARQMRQWLEQGADPVGRRKRHEEHPLVGAAGKLARQALQTRRPDRFLWIDEVGTASQIGSETSSPGEQRMHNLWIPPSRGWSTLDPDAQQLLADVLVLLILTEERGDRPKDALLRLKHAYSGEQNRLPPCLARDRTPLNPLQALVGETPCSLPGSNCADGCPFEFCPYPPKGPQCRTELNELFCIQQSSLLSPLQFQAWRFLRFRRRARWQRKVPVKNLLRFWDEMGARARNHSLKEASF